LLNYTIEYISVDKIFLKILSILKTKTLSNIVLLTNDIFQDFELLKDCDKDTLIFGINSNFLSAIGTDTKTVIHKKYNIKNLTSHSLFETSFSYQSRFFDRLKIPKVYIDTLLQILELFDYSLDLTRLDNSTLFKPIFINKGNKIVNFGQTNQFILANNDIEIANLEIKYLEENYCYGTIKIVNGTNLSEIQILNTIKKSTFNALYFIGLENKTIIKILQKNYKENRLIDL
jgi:ferrochelatase